jgi:hypothetical protein
MSDCSTRIKPNSEVSMIGGGGILPLMTLISLISLIFLDQDLSLFKTRIQNHHLFIICEIRAICGEYFGFQEFAFLDREREAQGSGEGGFD